MKDNLTANVSVKPLCLQLSLKTKWFEMTRSGIKKEDYRSITPYWVKRFCLYQNKKLNKNLNPSDILLLCKDLNRCVVDELIDYMVHNWYLSFEPFTQTILTLGYPKLTDTERVLKLEHKGIEIRTGNPEWGAEPNKLYFVIMHGTILA